MNANGNIDNLRKGNPGPWAGAGRPPSDVVRNRHAVLQSLAEMQVMPGEPTTLFEEVCRQIASLVQQGDSTMVKHLLEQWVGAPRSKVEVWLTEGDTLGFLAFSTARLFEEKGLTKEDFIDWWDQCYEALDTQQIGVGPKWLPDAIEECSKRRRGKKRT